VSRFLNSPDSREFRNLRSSPEVITAYLNELISKGIAEQLETGEYIRVNTFASESRFRLALKISRVLEAGENKLHKSAAEQSPTIAIITSLFL
jgi:hypothetical protein